MRVAHDTGARWAFARSAGASCGPVVSGVGCCIGGGCGVGGVCSAGACALGGGARVVAGSIGWGPLTSARGGARAIGAVEDHRDGACGGRLVSVAGGGCG